jgi:hypothetical protein
MDARRRPLAACPRIPPEFLDKEREKLGDAMFRQEYGCEFLQDDRSLFRDEDIRACMKPELEPLF